MSFRARTLSDALAAAAVGQPLLLTVVLTEPTRVEAYLIAEDEQRRNPLPLKADRSLIRGEVRQDWELQNGRLYDPEDAALVIAKGLLGAHLHAVDSLRYREGRRRIRVDEVVDEPQDSPESQLLSRHRRLNLAEILLQIQQLTDDQDLRELVGIISRQPRARVTGF